MAGILAWLAAKGGTEAAKKGAIALAKEIISDAVKGGIVHDLTEHVKKDVQSGLNADPNFTLTVQGKRKLLEEQIDKVTDLPNEGLANARVIEDVFEVFDSHTIPILTLLDFMADMITRIQSKVSLLWYQTCCNSKETWLGTIKQALHTANLIIGVSEAWTLTVSDKDWNDMITSLKSFAEDECKPYPKRKSRKQIRDEEAEARSKAILNRPEMDLVGKKWGRW